MKASPARLVVERGPRPPRIRRRSMVASWIACLGVALTTGLSEPTVKRRWQVARSWLLDALQNPIDEA